MIRTLLSTLVICCISVSGSLGRFENDALKENIEQGQRKYEEFQSNARHDKLGTCWSNAVVDLEKSCAHLDEKTMARLAYSFMTCHLLQHRRRVELCDVNTDVESCTEHLSDTMFGIYTSFVMHTHNMCFYLQSTMWQANMDQTVDRLQESSNDVATNLQIQATKQEQLLIGIDQVSDANNDILTQTSELQSFISHLSSVVEKISYIQQAFYSQFTTYEMILFYLGAIVVVLVCTSFPAFGGARSGMLGMTALAFAIEQSIAQYGLFMDDAGEVDKYKIQKQLRRVWLLLCMGSWIRSLYITRQNQNNSTELLERTRHNNELLLDLKMKFAPLTAAYKNSLFSDEETVTTEQTTQTDNEAFSPVVIKQKKYTKRRKSPPQEAVGMSQMCASPGRSGTGRYNLRPVTPPRAPLAPPTITWPGFSSDEDDRNYVPRLDTSEL